ncbi:MAG: Rossmann-like domain-containing protein [Anaerovoracaceae bacterium]|jgi:uncharacterized protein (DUF4213/DUF364 family)
MITDTKFEQKDCLLRESIDNVKKVLGDELKTITIERAALGLFFSGVKLSCGHGGLCFTPIKEIPEAVCCPSSAKSMPLSGKLAGRKAEEYLKDIFGNNILKKTLGIATLNALSTYCWDKIPEKDYEIIMGVDAFDEINIAPGSKTVVIGALAPMLRKLIAGNHEFKVLEMDPSTLKPKELEHFAPASEAPKYIPDADLVVITGVTVLNDTLVDLLSYVKEGADVIVTGPTVSMLPDAFLKRGVTIIGGIIVTKPDELLDIISEAGSGYHFFGKFAERLIIKKK